MIDLHQITRIVQEIAEADGDPNLLMQKLNSNITLTEQNEHLTKTHKQLEERTGNLHEQELEALSARDNALESERAARNQLTATTQNLATMLSTEPEARKIMQGIQQAENHLTNLKQEAATIERFIAPARWFLSLLFNRPDLLRKHREILNQPVKQEYTREIGEQVIQLAISEIQKHGGLVPKTKYTQASLAADNLKRQIESAIKPFLQNPKQLTLEQRRTLLGALIDSGLNAENLEQFRSQLAVSWRKCPIHKQIDLKVNLRTLKFECTNPGCTYNE